MALTAEQKALRKGKLTASAVGALMEGDEAKIFNLWCEMTGDPRYVEEDLDDVWPVQLGSETEALNLRWYEKKTGNKVTRKGEVVVHPDYPWVAATLDGWDSVLNIPIECKHVNGFSKLPNVIEKYTPQFHWQMFVTKTLQLKPSVIIGAMEPNVSTIEWDEFYWQTLWHRAQQFWKHVEAKTPPNNNGERMVAVAIPKDQLKTIDLPKLALNGQPWPNWASEMVSHLEIWLESRDAATKCDKAKDDVKKLLPADVGIIIHEEVRVVRDGRGVTLKAI